MEMRGGGGHQSTANMVAKSGRNNQNRGGGPWQWRPWRLHPR
jgi:hypothetical protein